jgi:uncharacterized membrane protein
MGGPSQLSRRRRAPSLTRHGPRSRPPDQLRLVSDSPPDNPVFHRQVIAVLAFAAALVAVYLHLVKIGVFGMPACGPGGGCAAAWFSPWGSFLGLDTAFIGAVGYALLTLVAILGTLPGREDDPRITQVMLLMIVGAIAFTWRLKYGEWYRMRIFCIWCFESFVTIHLCGWLAWRDWKRVSAKEA